MKSVRFLLPVVLMSLATLAFAQSEANKPADKPVPTDAQKSFSLLKSLSGAWQGSVTTDPPLPNMGNGTHTQVTMRVTSSGNALVHEIHEPDKPDDPTKYEHPLTMLYLDRDRLLLTHYCDAGNRPRMAARTSPDGKTVEFDFVDLSGGTQFGYMYHALFTVIDASHHTEDWTYMMTGDKPLRAHLDLKRTQ